MWHSAALVMSLVGLAFVVAMAFHSGSSAEENVPVPHYLRVSVAHWKINVYSEEAERIFRQIATDGVAVFRAQPGFVRYRLMRADSTTTIAVAEWESQQLGQAGAERYRAWMRSVGIMDRFTLEMQAGDIVAAS
jgi:quinol monooxygenase YgiN